MQKPPQAAILYLVRSRDFMAKFLLPIAKTGEDILNHNKLLEAEHFQYGGYDLELWPRAMKT